MKRSILVVDGYNMIGAWPELVRLKKHERLADARDRLLFELSNYGKYKNIEIIVVFDAQFVPGIQKEYTLHQLQVVFTKSDETADSYIEKLTGNLLTPLTIITVATSDLAEQWTVFSRGALRKSAYELYRDVEKTKEEITQDTLKYRYEQLHKNVPWSLEQLADLENLRDNLK
ncbi:NYN domain-containing protein [Vagococcus humatus]|uniref:DNA-binding protein n=1 Tax=Vagococcus humatus TaxID=1889241 RepID=A0A3R9YWH1_9ENTE|nr:NYN domain-containing protein [Vagococcus humatus]RST88923.1 DNA-binding protein [Vagococcus humatus]